MNNTTQQLERNIGIRHLSWTLALPALALAAWLLAGMVNHLIVEQHRDLPTLHSLAPAPPDDLLPSGGDRDGQVLCDLFDPPACSRKPEPPVPGDPPQDPANDPGAALPRSALPVSLVGTIVADDPRWSLASITTDQTRDTDLYRAGDELLQEADIVSIHVSGLVLNRAGQFEFLALAGGPPKAMNATAPNFASSAANKASGLVQKVGLDDYRVDRDKLQHLLTHPADLARQARITLAVNKSGDVDGVRLAGLSQASVFAELGLRRSDVIRRVNDYPLDSPERMLEIFARLKTARKIELEVTRSGRTRTLQYAID